MSADFKLTAKCPHCEKDIDMAQLEVEFKMKFPLAAVRDATDQAVKKFGELKTAMDEEPQSEEPQKEEPQSEEPQSEEPTEEEKPEEGQE